jgi:lysophospholipase L1-like esterase
MPETLEGPPARPLRRAAALAAAVALSLAAGLLLVELLLRAFLPLHFVGGTADAYQYDEELGARLVPARHHLETSDFLEEVHTNRLGTVNFQESFQDYGRLVFALGDSFTQGTGVASDASYPFQLDLLLNLRGGRYEKRFAVVNLGLAALGMKQSLIALRRYREEIGTPDAVLFLGCSNDWSDDRLFDSGYRHRHLVAGSPHYGPFLRPLQWIGFGSEVGKRAKLLLGALRRRGVAGTEAANYGQAGAEGARTNVAELQEPLFEELRARAEEMGARLVVSWTDPPGDASGSYAWLRAWAARRGVAFADWHARAESVRAALPALSLENPHSGGHYRTWVNQMLAAAFAEQLEP